jgi:TadE-like protein
MSAVALSNRRCSGLALVEFAICAPLLLLLLMATAEFGRLLYQYNTLTKTVRDGARYAAREASITSGSTHILDLESEIISRTENLVIHGNILGTGPALVPGLTAEGVDVIEAVDASGNPNGFVRVSATFQFAPAMGSTLPTFGFGEPLDLTATLTASVVMR